MNAQTVSSQQVISAVQAMPLDELEKLVGDVLAVRAERVAPHITGEESKLLRTVQKTLPKKSLLRMKQLQALRDDAQLSTEDYAELAALVEKLEIIHAERMEAVSKLAQLRGITFQTALKQIGLRLPDHE
jgi:hypothetical protein